MSAIVDKEDMNRRRKDYLEFFTELADAFRNRICPRLPAPKPENKYLFPAGPGGAHFKWAFNGRTPTDFSIELHFESKNRETRLTRLGEVEKLRHEIERLTGENVVFEHTQREARLCIKKNEGRMTEDLKKWAVENMVILYSVLRPVLDKLA